MTSPEMILARATAKGGQYEQYVGGGLSAFTSAQVGHFLAGMKRGEKGFTPLPDAAMRILLIRYVDGDERDIDELLKDMMDDAGQVRDWVTHAAHTAICRVVLREFLSARRCGVCEGRTTVKRGNLIEQCQDCDATGYKPLSDTARAKACGVPYAAFRRGGPERYYIARLRRLHEWEGQGLARVVEKGRAGMVVLNSTDEIILRKLARGDEVRFSYDTYKRLIGLPMIGDELGFIPNPVGDSGTAAGKTTDRALEEAARDLLAAAGLSLHRD